MKKIILLLIVLLSLSLLVVAEDETKIDYDDPASIASAPASEINIAQAISSGNGAAITTTQWFYGNNLNQAGDLSQFVNAHQAVSDKHSLGLAKFNLGSVNYNDGIVTNGKISIDLNKEDLSGVDVFSLADGGFAIGKGKSQGEFTLDNGKSFDLTDSNFKEPVEVRDDGSLYLPKDVEATLSSIGGSPIKVISINGMEIDTDKSKLIIEGQYEYYIPENDIAGMGGSEKVGSGKVEYNCDLFGVCAVNNFENNVVAVTEGGKVSGDNNFEFGMDQTLALVSKKMLFDEEMLKKIAKLGPQDWIAKGAVPPRYDTILNPDYNPWVDTPLEADTDVAFVDSLSSWIAATNVDALKQSGTEEKAIGKGISLLENNKKMTLYYDLSDKTKVTLIPRYSVRAGQYGGVIELQFKPSLSNELITLGLTPMVDFGGPIPGAKKIKIDQGIHLGFHDGPMSFTMLQDSEKMMAMVAYNNKKISAGVNLYTESALAKLIKSEEFGGRPEGGFGAFFELRN
jgi:hypothetical protein